MSLLNRSGSGFYYKGNATGILLIHGFTGCPDDMKQMGEYLAEKGFTVRGVLLKGHGATKQEMRKAGYRDWIQSTVLAYKALKQECDEVFAVGFSMGGALALYLGRIFDVKGLVSIAAPIKIRCSKTLMSTLSSCYKDTSLRKLKRLGKTIPKDYYFAPIGSVRNLFVLVSYIEDHLNKIEKPILIMQSYKDQTVHPISANIIYNRIGSADKSIIYYHKSDHSLVSGCEKEQVFEEVYQFVANKATLSTTMGNAVAAYNG